MRARGVSRGPVFFGAITGPRWVTHGVSSGERMFLGRDDPGVCEKYLFFPCSQGNGGSFGGGSPGTRLGRSMTK